MNDDNHPPSRSWFDRLLQYLQGEPKDREDIVDDLRLAEQRGLIKPDALGMLEGVFQVSEMQARDIMIPRSQTVVINRDASLEDIIPLVVESRHSRFPVIGENMDDVVGILLAKDLLSFFGQSSDELKAFHTRDIVRHAIIIPESKRLDVLLREFRSSRNHMAVVVDEYGSVSGVVTIEDVLEQIVGEIEDEYDIDEEDNIKAISDTESTVKAQTTIEEFNECFATSFENHEFDTIGGLVLQGFGHMPSQGESVTVGDYIFEVLHADGRRINLLRAIKSPVETEKNDENAA